MPEIKVVAPLVGEVPAAQSTTIQAAKKAQWTVVLGSALAFLMNNVDTVQTIVMTVLPPHWYGVAVAAVQLVTAAGALYYGKKTIDGRIDATQRIAVTKSTDLHSFLFFTMIGLVTVMIFSYTIGVALAQTTIKPVVISWNLTVPPNADGFRLYKGKNTSSLVKIADIAGGDTRQFTYQRTDTNAACYGLSAFNAEGESEITYKQDNGVNLCLGKPTAPVTVKAIQ